MIMMSYQDEEQIAARAMESRNYEEAFRLMQPLVEKGSQYALLSLGWIYQTGAVGPPDNETARDYYERAASEGSDLAHLYLGRLLASNKDERGAKSAFERGAELGNSECVVELEKLAHDEDERHAEGLIAAGQFKHARIILEGLANKGSQYALLTLGWMHETGTVEETDMKKARAYYERAMIKGSAPACFELGRLFLRQGKEEQARISFETGAVRGDTSSMARLGRMMVEGRGGPSDADAGSAWLKKAVARGHIMAERTLLGIEESDARSLSDKLSIKRRIASLAKRGAREISEDPDSDKLR
jgi:TPR repeat protein